MASRVNWVDLALLDPFLLDRRPTLPGSCVSREVVGVLALLGRTVGEVLGLEMHVARGLLYATHRRAQWQLLLRDERKLLLGVQLPLATLSPLLVADHLVLRSSQRPSPWNGCSRPFLRLGRLARLRNFWCNERRGLQGASLLQNGLEMLEGALGAGRKDS